jgi:serine/threonine protein kinase
MNKRKLSLPDVNTDIKRRVKPMLSLPILMKEAQDQQEQITKCKHLENINLYFEELNTLGSGTFGRVYAARTTPAGHLLHPGLPHMVAVKILTSVENIPILKNELAILKRLDLPHSVKYYGCYIEKSHVYLIMDLITGDDLFELDVSSLSPDEKLHIAKEIALGIEEIHAAGIAHRDIKLENIMITDTWDVKIVDYGLACAIAHNPESETCTEFRIGTPGYMDYRVVPGNLKSMQRADWWSYGQLLGELFTNNINGLWDERRDTYRAFPKTELRKVPKALATMLFELTYPDNNQGQRPTPAEIMAALGL